MQIHMLGSWETWLSCLWQVRDLSIPWCRDNLLYQIEVQLIRQRECVAGEQDRQRDVGISNLTGLWLRRAGSTNRSYEPLLQLMQPHPHRTTASGRFTVSILDIDAQLRGATSGRYRGQTTNVGQQSVATVSDDKGIGPSILLTPGWRCLLCDRTIWCWGFGAATSRERNGVYRCASCDESYNKTERVSACLSRVLVID